ncbi:tyrosine-type recombinase/integrase [Limnoglobus roseus]|uniref:Site-specific integrase n=1 Tax=Limnoglobus roseus TaxID=2598579 RepID=A0A5C1ALA5_9BACT|nr:tyrosine-type recombinase/integrase [Limnoglobus roseus]QEL19355.1 site-specific integrase [Limnoglobus roseus]
MSHSPKPFFRSARNAWYVQVGKQQIKLTPGPKNAVTEKAAWAEFYRVMAAPRPSPVSREKKSTELSVAELLDKFLSWTEKHRAGRSLEWYTEHLQSFCKSLKPSAKTLLPTDLKPHHLQDWVDSPAHAKWGANQRRGAIVAVLRPFNWAVKLGYLDKNPVNGVEKPQATKRESTVTAADFTRLLGFVKDAAFRDLLIFAYEVGVRPQEARLIEARHVHLDKHRIEIPPAEAKGKRRWRVIYLTTAAEESLAKLRSIRPTGKLFRNIDGNPWRAQAVVSRFQRLLVKMSGAIETIPPLPRFDRRRYKGPAKLAEARAAHQKAVIDRRKERAALARKGKQRFALYDLRHLFATRKLKEGHDPITVATLLGHRDASMLCRHYESLSTDGEHLLAAVNSTVEKAS